MHAVFMGMPSRLANGGGVMPRCRETHNLSQRWHDRDCQTVPMLQLHAVNLFAVAPLHSRQEVNDK